MTSITTEYHEKIQIPSQDVIPKSRAFNCLKYSILTSLMILIILAIISAIVAESFVKSNKKEALAIGIVAVVGICLFILGMIAILKEHIPLVLCFSFSLIIYLLIFMYSRIFTTPGWIIVRTLVILTLAIAVFAFAIMIREWRYLQMSKLNHTAMKRYAQQYQQSLYSVHYEVPSNIYQDNYYSELNAPYPNSVRNFAQPQPQVFINGIPNQNRRQNFRKANQQVHFQPQDQDSFYPAGYSQQQSPLVGRTSPFSNRQFPQQQQQQQQQPLSGRFNSYQQSEAHQSRTLPPYVDVCDENPYNNENERFGQIYYK